MNDDAEHAAHAERLELANAYVDGELSSDDRARAEADPEVLAAVADLQAVRQALRTVPAPDASQRERVIAAALAVHAELAAGAVRPAAVPTPISRPRRRARVAWGGLAAAAALIAVVAAGAVLVRNDGSGDDAASTGATAQVDAAERATAGTSLEAPMAASGAEPTSEATSKTSVSSATAAAAAPAAGTAGDDQASPAPAPGVGETSPLPALGSLDDLAAFAAGRPTAESALGGSACSGGTFVGRAVYTAPDGTSVVVDVFLADGDAVARATATCAIVARTPAR